MGKSTGSDETRGKVTFPALMGLDASRAKLRELVHQATEALAVLGEEAAPLRLLAEYIVERDS